VAAYQADCTEIIRNPHLDQEWAAAAVRSPTLLEAVCKAIGPSAAVENTFLVIKWPRHPFEVPWHQDGIDARLELDPDRSVAAWLALTDATETSGCLHVVPGSHRRGYLPFGPEANAGQPRGRADEARGVSGQGAIPVPVEAGHAVLMDMRLLHRSGSNDDAGARIGLNIRYVAPDGIRRRDPQTPSPVPVSGPGWSFREEST
jgi:ectoine hydroxylase-related dioxygenase (phytanoyl-CoA dioxygenase family)